MDRRTIQNACENDTVDICIVNSTVHISTVQGYQNKELPLKLK